MLDRRDAFEQMDRPKTIVPTHSPGAARASILDHGPALPISLRGSCS
jgi:hypothetical protein